MSIITSRWLLKTVFWENFSYATFLDCVLNVETVEQKLETQFEKSVFKVGIKDNYMSPKFLAKTLPTLVNYTKSCILLRKKDSKNKIVLLLNQLVNIWQSKEFYHT